MLTLKKFSLFKKKDGLTTKNGFSRKKRRAPLEIPQDSQHKHNSKATCLVNLIFIVFTTFIFSIVLEYERVLFFLWDAITLTKTSYETNTKKKQNIYACNILNQ